MRDPARLDLAVFPCARGIVVAGRSAGLRGAIAWLELIIVAAPVPVPVLAFVSFLFVATLSGALGNPFRRCVAQGSWHSDTSASPVIVTEPVPV